MLYAVLNWRNGNARDIYVKSAHLFIAWTTYYYSAQEAVHNATVNMNEKRGICKSSIHFKDKEKLIYADVVHLFITFTSYQNIKACMTPWIFYIFP